jgi:hypothetical protein
MQKHTDLRAHDFAQSPDLWRQPRFANVTTAYSRRLHGINPATSRSFPVTKYYSTNQVEQHKCGDWGKYLEENEGILE